MIDLIQTGTKADMAQELLVISGQSVPSLTAEKRLKAQLQRQILAALIKLRG